MILTKLIIVAGLLLCTGKEVLSQGILNREERQTQMEDANRLYREGIQSYYERKYGEATSYLDKALKALKNLSGTNTGSYDENRNLSLQIAGTLDLLGVAYSNDGQHEKAGMLLREALSLWKTLLPSSDPRIARCINNLATNLSASGRHDEAEQLLAALLKNRTHEKDPELAPFLSNWAAVLMRMGKLKGAEEPLTRALELDEQALSPYEIGIAADLNNLAALYYQLGKPGKALPFFQRAYTIKELALGQNHIEVGRTLEKLRELSTAVSAQFERQVSESSQDRSNKLERLQVLIHQGTMFRNQGAIEEAIRTANSVLSISESDALAYDSRVTDFLDQIHQWYRDWGQFREAFIVAERSYAIKTVRLSFRQTDPEMKRGIANSLRDLARLYKDDYKYRDFDRAEALYQRSLKVFVELEDSMGIAMVLNDQSMLYAQRGEFVKAKTLVDEGIRKLGAKHLWPDEMLLATMHQNLASLYADEGDYQKAETEYRQALAFLDAYKARTGVDAPLRIDLILEISTLHSDKGDTTKAHQLLDDAKRLQRLATGPLRTEPHKRLANAFLKKGDHDKALALFQEALNIDRKAYPELHPDMPLNYENLSRVMLLKGDFNRAKQYAEKARNLNAKLFWEVHPSLARNLNLQARIHLAQGNIREALRVQRENATIRETNILELFLTGSEADKIVYLDNLKGETNQIISLHSVYAPKQTEALELALETVLRRKGRVLDATSESLTRLRRHLGPDEQKMLNEIQEKRKQLTRLKSPSHGLIEEIEVKEALLSSRSADYRLIQELITVEKVRQGIPKNAALIEYFVYRPLNARAKNENEWYGESRYVAYLIRPTGPVRWIDLGTATVIDELVKQFLEALSEPSGEHYKNSARILARKLFCPIEGFLGDTRMVFLAPDGNLNILPFGALLDDEDRFLIKRFLFTYLTSGRDLFRFQLEGPSANAHAPVIVTNPDYYLYEINESRQQWNSMPKTESEAKAVQEYFPRSRVLRWRNATEDEVKKVHRPEILHLSTHGFYVTGSSSSSKQPQDGYEFEATTFPSEVRHKHRVTLSASNFLNQSGLVLAGANGYTDEARDDGILTALEMMYMDLYGTQLVVLSACESGLGSGLGGEGIYGLRRALVLAGAESQIMSLWKVDEDATRQLIIGYYKRLSKGKGRSESLHEVQNDFLDKKDSYQSDFSHPFFWASFVSLGKWTPMGDLQSH